MQATRAQVQQAARLVGDLKDLEALRAAVVAKTGSNVDLGLNDDRSKAVRLSKPEALALIDRLLDDRKSQLSAMGVTEA